MADSLAIPSISRSPLNRSPSSHPHGLLPSQGLNCKMRRTPPRHEVAPVETVSARA
jgi:hypothetical protein